jgi:hypothetical protein
MKEMIKEATTPEQLVGKTVAQKIATVAAVCGQ